MIIEKNLKNAIKKRKQWNTKKRYDLTKHYKQKSDQH